MTRTTWVRSHPRRLPDADAFAKIHIELGRAYLCEQTIREIEREISDLPPEQIAQIRESF